MIAVHRLRNITLAVAGVATATAISKSAGFNASTAGFAFLLVVLFSATGGGIWPGIAASVLATACFNFFFLPPIGTFHIAGSGDWAALAAFLTVAIVASRLVFRRERCFQNLLHNETPALIQHRLQWVGVPMVILPIRASV